MTDKDFNLARRRIRLLIRKWHQPLGLRFWHLHHRFLRDSREFVSNVDGVPDALACTLADWRYMHATVSWNMQEVADTSADDLEYAFVHEMMHVLVNEMREDGKGVRRGIAHEERVCTQLAWAFIWTREAGGKGK